MPILVVRLTAIDKPALHPLRTNSYVYREHKRATVGIDYHIELQGNGYSVPYTYKGKKVDIWYSKTTVSILYKAETIALHKRVHHPHQDSTLKEHMPPEHQYQYEKWNPGRILNWANKYLIKNKTKKRNRNCLLPDMRHNSYIELEEKEELELYKFIEASNKAREKKRAMGILLNAQKTTVLEISKKLGSCTDAIYNWLIRYREGGVSALKDIPQPGRPKRLQREDEPTIKEVLKK